jgi:glutamyl-tRNA reductase
LIRIAGIDYESASVKEREKFSFTTSEAADFLARASHKASECVLLSTCNRTELCLVSDEDPAAMLREARGQGKLFSCSGREAVKRIFEIAAGLRSQVPLDEQILTQLKDALSLSQSLKCAGPVLNKLFSTAITTGKKVRTEFKEMPHDTSIAEIACGMAEAEFKGVRDRSALIVGSGVIGQLCAVLLRKGGANVSMTLRRRKKEDFLPLKGVNFVPYDDRYGVAEHADIIISATASPHYVLTAERFVNDGRKVLIMDLAVPHDVEPAVKDIPNVRLLDMDAMGGWSLDPELLKDIRGAIDEDMSYFYDWLKIHNCMPLIDEVCSYAAKELVCELSPENDAETKKLEEATRKMMGKLLFTMKNEVDIDLAADCYDALAKAARG